jgi:hypothetical protein
MKTLANLLVTSILSLPVAAVLPADPDSLIKATEIKPENAKDGIKKMIQTGFLKPIVQTHDGNEGPALKVNDDSEGRALRSRRPRHPPHDTGRTKPRADTTRHQRDDEWYDDYFVSAERINI